MLDCEKGRSFLPAGQKMPLPNWPMVSDQYKKHRLANHRDWNASKARKMSLDDPPNAQFNPHELPNPEQIEALERLCITKGTPITDLSDTSRKRHEFYLDCRTILALPRSTIRPISIVGYSSGELTPFILTKWNSSGGFHGQPITESELRTRGIQT